jgi:hypothetical protein
MSATAPKGVDAYFSETKTPRANYPPPSSSQEPEESIKTTVYITADQRDYIDQLRFKLRRARPGLTRSAVIRLALDTLAQMDEQKVSAEILSHHDSVMA